MDPCSSPAHSTDDVRLVRELRELREEERLLLREARLTDGRGGQMESRPAARRMAHVGRVHDVWPVKSE